MPLDPPPALPDDSARASLEKAMQAAESTSAKVKGRLKSAAITGAKVAGAGAAVAAAPVAVVTAPVWAPAALLAAPVVYEGGKLALQGGKKAGGAAVDAAKWAVEKVEHANAKQEEKANQRFAVQNADMISALSQPLPGGLTTNPAVRNLLADHIKGSATQMSPEEAVQMAAIGEHIYKTLSEGGKIGPNGMLAVNVPGRDSPVMVPPGNFAAKAVSWHLMAAAAQSNLERQNLPGAKRDDMTNSGTFILKDPGNHVYDFLNANPMVAQRMSSHYEERLDHDKKVPIAGNTLQKGCDDYQNKFPGGGGALLFDKLKGGEIFVKFEHAGTPKPTAKEGHDTKTHTAMRGVLAANRWVEHSFSFLESLNAGAGDPNKVVRQEDIHKGEMKAAVYEPYLATLKAATDAGVITKREAEAMKSHARAHGLPSVTGGLEIIGQRQRQMQDLDPAKAQKLDFAAQTLKRNIDYKLESMGQGNNDLGIQRRGGEVHLSADPNKYLPAQGPAQQAPGFDPPAVMDEGFTLHENTDKTNAQASETYSMRADEGQVIGAQGETRAFAKAQLDASGFPDLQQEQTDVMNQMAAISSGSQNYKDWNAKKAQVDGLEKGIESARKELAKSEAKLAEMMVNGTDEQKAAWQRNVTADQAELDTLLERQNNIVQLQAEVDQLAQHPDVVKYQELAAQREAVKQQITPLQDIANASAPLFKKSEDMANNPAMGGDRSLLSRSVASYQVDQLLGTNVVAEEKLAVAPPPDGRLMGVSVQADGAQVTGKHGNEDCFLKTDYSDPRIQRGMADLEAVDYITGQIDRHNGNIFVHPESGKVTGIDNDLAFPEQSRQDVIKAYSGLQEKAVKGVPQFMSQETADKILATTPEQLAEMLAGIKNPDGTGGLSHQEILGATTRLQELQNAIKDPSSGLQVVKEFNQQTYEATIQKQRELLAQQTGLPELAQPAADFKDIDNPELLAGAYKASYLGNAVLVGQKYELLQGQQAGDLVFGVREGNTANVTARVDPEFAEYKKQEQSARQSLAADPRQIEDLGVRREVTQLQAQVGQLQQQLDDCQKKLDKLDAGPQTLAEKAKARLGIGTGEKRQELMAQKQEVLQNLKQAQQGLDKALDKAVQPLQAELRLNAREKVAEQGIIAQQKENDMSLKVAVLRELAEANGLDPKALKLGGPGDPAPDIKKISDLATNSDINAASFRERAGEMQAKSPAEAKLAGIKGDRDEAFGKALRAAAAALQEDGAEINTDKINAAFAAAKEQSDRHDQEENLQNEQRLELYQKEVAAAVTPVLEAQGFTPEEIEVFTEAAVKLGMEAEGAALKNNEATAKMYAGQLKDGLENSSFKYSDHNPEAGKIHDALYRANNTNAHIHADGDVEIKRGHASFQEKTANRVLAEAAAGKGVQLDPVKAPAPAVDTDAEKLEGEQPKVEGEEPKVEGEQPKVDGEGPKAGKSVADMLGRHRAAAPQQNQNQWKTAEKQDGGKQDVRASLGIQRTAKEPGAGQQGVEQNGAGEKAGKVGAKVQPKQAADGPAAKPALGKTL